MRIAGRHTCSRASANAYPAFGSLEQKRAIMVDDGDGAAKPVPAVVANALLSSIAKHFWQWREAPRC